MNKIPTQIENPLGLHQRYYIQKIVERSEEEMQAEADFRIGIIKERHIGEGVPVNKYKLVDTDENSEYFVMRLDEGGKDPEHIKACRIGVNAYADAISQHLPELAKDLKERYPVNQDGQAERMFSLKEMKDLADAMEALFIWKGNPKMAGFSKRPPDKQQYFKQKFNIDL